MSTDKQCFTIRVSASRLEKGLLAIPQKFKDQFPSTEGQIEVAFDDEEKTKALTFRPYDATVKEVRIFGLGRWFSRRGVQEGDLISITLEDPAKRQYRIALDRFVQEREEARARQKLQAASTDSEANEEFSTLSRLTQKRPRELAQEELLRVSGKLLRQPRPRVLPSAIGGHQAVTAGIRVLLRELHDGKCQICSFTFDKRNGEPYFEIHHLDAEVGHHPCNLLVVCPNCHAQLEHAQVTDLKWLGNWLVGVTINGKRLAVRQPLAHDSIRRVLVGLGVALTVMQIRRLVFR